MIGSKNIKIKKFEVNFLNKITSRKVWCASSTHSSEELLCGQAHCKVKKNYNKRFYDLITKFKEKTNCPMIVNTSFNIRGEPMVNSPNDAFNCFMGTDLDYLVIGNSILDKSKQKINTTYDYKNKFELD